MYSQKMGIMTKRKYVLKGFYTRNSNFDCTKNLEVLKENNVMSIPVVCFHYSPGRLLLCRFCGDLTVICVCRGSGGSEAYLW